MLAHIFAFIVVIDGAVVKQLRVLQSVLHPAKTLAPKRDVLGVLAICGVVIVSEKGWAGLNT